MALIKCPECNYEISDTANTCVKCGYDLSLKSNIEIKLSKRGKKTSFPPGTDIQVKQFRLPADTYRKVAHAVLDSNFKTQEEFVNQALLEYCENYN